MAGERSSSTSGPLAPSRGDQVVNHVIVVGRVTRAAGRGRAATGFTRRARPVAERSGSASGAGST
eukprot:5412452-Prymnesium_polylepis.1